MDVSVIIPARNEEFLKGTIEHILAAAKAETEIIAVCDGYWPEPGIQDNDKVILIHHNDPVGQRVAVNEAAHFSKAKYIIKTDGHSMMDEGFDIKLMADCEYDWTVIPRMYNLHVFDWQCPECGDRLYQGPKPKKCSQCGKNVKFQKVEVWQSRKRRRTDYMYIDNNLRVQYYNHDNPNPNKSKRLIDDVMTGQGACFFMHRQRFLDLGSLDEAHGIWGQVGVEVACKAWLSGGRQVVNKKTWFAHMFRTQKDFGFPYKLSGRVVNNARNYSRELWLNDNWPMQKRKFNWLIEKFAPVPTWDKKLAFSTKKISQQNIIEFKKETAELTKGIVYYTSNRASEHILKACRLQLTKIGLPVVSVSLIPLDFYDNIVIDEKPGILTMFRQILAGLKRIRTDIVFLCEHDIIYHPSHFDFIPQSKYVYYYNYNVWKVDAKTGQALFYETAQTSGLCAYRKLLIEHYTKRIERVERKGFTRRMGFEPGTHSYPRGIDDYKAERYFSAQPNIDIRHNSNLTANRFSKDQFRSERSIRGWTLTDKVPFWGKTKGCFDGILRNIVGEGVKELA